MKNELQREIERMEKLKELDIEEYQRVLKMVVTYIEKNGMQTVPSMVGRWRHVMSKAPKSKKSVWGGWMPALDYAMKLYDEHQERYINP